MPYITGGFDGYLDAIRAAGAGADAIEIGIPFSDPVMDGPVIQQANEIVLAKGSPRSRSGRGRRARCRRPDGGDDLLQHRVSAGLERFASRLRAGDIAGASCPTASGRSGAVGRGGRRRRRRDGLLAAPTTTDERLPQICERSRGFVYAVGLAGGHRRAGRAGRQRHGHRGRCKAVTDKPVLVGVGVSTPAQAAKVSEVADGCVVGTAIVRRLIEGGGPEAVGALVGELRAALDAG